MQRKITLLIIDDDSNVCETLKLHLERSHGFSVHTAQDGRSGLRLAQKIVPDVILLDVMMPGMSGGQVAETLREFRSTERIPVIFLTGALTKAEAEERGGEFGGELFLAKPVSGDEIAATVRSVLQRAASGRA